MILPRQDATFLRLFREIDKLIGNCAEIEPRQCCRRGNAGRGPGSSRAAGHMWVGALVGGRGSQGPGGTPASDCEVMTVCSAASRLWGFASTLAGFPFLNCKLPLRAAD